MKIDPHRRSQILIAAGIFLLALLTFLPALWNDFVSLDDSLYVYDNPLVKGGLTPQGVARAFAGPECNFYHPLTMISLMLDHQLWGLNPAGYHLTNILLHAASSALLFLALAQMTGARWRSAFVAALFAVHPLRVESVAWIAERKDVLSVFFFTLTLVAYAWYARRPRKGRYLAVLAIFIVGLLCKTSLVTLPGVLLLLDYWPLDRFSEAAPDRRRIAVRLFAEKVPMFALAIAASLVAAHAQKFGIIPYEDYPLWSRLLNAVHSYAIYLGQTFVPAGLSPFYPFLQDMLAPWKIAASLLLLAGITACALAWRRKAPYFLVGWLWYLGVLVPMIGVVQVGAFAHADRFTYLPQIGLLIILAWGTWDLTQNWKSQAALLSGFAGCLLVASVVLTIRQVQFWSGSEVLFRHALAVTRDNGLAHGSLGAALLENRKHGVLVPGAPSPAKRAEAIVHFREAVRLLPSHADAHLNLGLALAASDAHEEAISHLQTALETMPFHARGQCMLGLLLVEKGEMDDGIRHLQESVRQDPNDRLVRNNLGAAFRRQGRLQEAVEQYRAALQLAPDFADARNNLGVALFMQGHKAEAVQEFREALRHDPENAQARQNLNAALQ